MSKKHSAIDQDFIDSSLIDLDEEAKALASQDGEEFFELTYALDSLSHNDIDLNSAIGELVDNSMDAGANNIYIDIRYGNKKNPIEAIICSDDGCGMTNAQLRKSLQWGGTSKKPERGKKMGIGRFGVGLSAATNRIADRTVVYSRVGDSFDHTFIDLDDVRKGTMTKLPAPTTGSPSFEGWKNPIEHAKTGTVILMTKIKNVTRQETDNLPVYLARTYRKYIAAGRNIYLRRTNGEGEYSKIYLHDPLYVDGPTRFDMNDKSKPEDLLRGSIYQKVGVLDEPIKLPGSDGNMHEVTIRLSITPKEWRKQLPGDGNSKFAKDHHINENEGVSVLRADREVCYGKIPKLISKRGRRYEEKDRWWSMEISFPPELDKYFTVQHIKRGIEPTAELKAMIREHVGPTIDAMVKEIDRNSREAREERRDAEGPFKEAEDHFNKCLKLLPTPATKTYNKDNAYKQAEEAYKHVKGNPKAKEERKKSASEKLPGWQFECAPLPTADLYTVTRIDGGKTILIINSNHAFYRSIIEPLIQKLDEGGDPMDSEILNALTYLFASHSFAEDMFSQDDNRLLFDLHRSQWSTVLATSVTDLR